MARHIHTPPEPPTLYSLFSIPRRLDQIVLACLAKQPEDRPATARELADLLTECEVGERVEPRACQVLVGIPVQPEAAVSFSD